CQKSRQVAHHSADQERTHRREEVAREQRRKVRRGKRLRTEDSPAEWDGRKRRTVVVVVAGAVSAYIQLRLAIQVDEPKARQRTADATGGIGDGIGALQIDGE